MDQNEHDTTDEHGQDHPKGGISSDPSQNTSPPSNPPVDREAVEKGKDKLDSIVNW